MGKRTCENKIIFNVSVLQSCPQNIINHDDNEMPETLFWEGDSEKHNTLTRECCRTNSPRKMDKITLNPGKPFCMDKRKKTFVF